METLFGKCYETIGNVNADLLLKTRGDIKIQIGNQFTNLFQDNINFISEEITSSNIPSQNGLYFYNKNLYIVYNGDAYKVSMSKIN